MSTTFTPNDSTDLTQRERGLRYLAASGRAQRAALVTLRLAEDLEGRGEDGSYWREVSAAASAERQRLFDLGAALAPDAATWARALG